LGNAILRTAGAFDDVYELIGSAADFIRRCCASPLIQTAWKKPQKTDEGVPIIQIDRNSSYPAIYRDFEGIPAGPPHWMSPRSFDIEDPATVPAYYFILINVHSFKCRHKIDPFPLIDRVGLHYLDKVSFRLLSEHYDLNYDFINGLGFSSFNTKIADVSRSLYAERMKAKKEGHSKTGLIIKRLLNSLWGKSIQKANPTYEVFIREESITGFKSFNANFLYSCKKDIKRTEQEGQYVCRLIKPLLVHWSCPQFAASVLSFSRAYMQTLTYRAIDNNIRVLMINTDSLTMTLSDFNKFNTLCFSLLSSELGGFSIEVESTCFIAISPRKYIHRLKTTNETRIRCLTKIRGGKNNVWTFFNELYDEAKQQNESAR
jgi:hypothetical protein